MKQRTEAMGDVQAQLASRFGTYKTAVKQKWPRTNTDWQSLLAGVAIGTALIFVVMGAVAKWRHGGGSGSVAVDTLWRTTWIIYVFAKLLLLAVILATVIHYMTHRSSSKQS